LTMRASRSDFQLRTGTNPAALWVCSSTPSGLGCQGGGLAGGCAQAAAHSSAAPKAKMAFRATTKRLKTPGLAT